MNLRNIAFVGRAQPSVASGYLYYRLNVTATQFNATPTGSSEFELYASEGGSNLALGRPTLVSTCYAGVDPNGAELVDGITTSALDSGWITTGGAPAWCSVQLASRASIYKYRFGSYPTPTDPVNRSFRDFTFEGSNDNSGWTVLKTVTGCYIWSAGSMRSFIAGTPPAFRYYRLNVDQNNGDIDYGGIIEWEIYESVGGPNVALGKTGTSSSALGGYEASKAFDGSLASGSGWIFSAGGTQVVRQWIQVDLETAKTLGYYKVGSYSSGNNTANRSSKDFEILGSNDGTEWYHLHSAQDQTGWTFPELRTFTP